MAKSVQDILNMIQENDIKMVDFKMVDINGQYRHVTIPAENFSEDTMKSGIGFDASNYGYAVVEKSDMVFIPDPDTAMIDPFCDIPTLTMSGNTVGLYAPTDVIEEIELKLGQNEHLVGNTARLHFGNGRLDDVTGILRQRSILGGVDDHRITRHREGRDLTEGIDHGGIGVGNEDHIALFHHGIAVVGGIEADAALHRFLRKAVGGDGHVAVLTVDVHHLEVHHLDVFFTDQVHDRLNFVLHRIAPFL